MVTAVWFSSTLIVAVSPPSLLVISGLAFTCVYPCHAKAGYPLLSVPSVHVVGKSQSVNVLIVFISAVVLGLAEPLLWFETTLSK